MDDLVARLRATSWWPNRPDCVGEAADRIEALEKALREIAALLDGLLPQ